MSLVDAESLVALLASSAALEAVGLWRLHDVEVGSTSSLARENRTSTAVL